MKLEDIVQPLRLEDSSKPILVLSELYRKVAVDFLALHNVTEDWELKNAAPNIVRRLQSIEKSRQRISNKPARKTKDKFFDSLEEEFLLPLKQRTLCEDQEEVSSSSTTTTSTNDSATTQNSNTCLGEQ
ncbi:hypothetical protein ACHWQZ_G012084 [Mnemiopsis leidyi]